MSCQLLTLLSLKILTELLLQENLGRTSGKKVRFKVEFYSELEDIIFAYFLLVKTILLFTLFFVILITRDLLDTSHINLGNCGCIKQVV